MPELFITDELLAPLKGGVVFITGGSSGIGLATVKLLLSLHAKVINVDLNEGPEPPAAAEGAYKFIKANVASWSELRAAFAVAVQEYGQIDHVFANAGMRATAKLLEHKLDDDGNLLEPDLTCLQVNLVGVIYTFKLGLYHLKQNPGGGSIVLTASTSSFQTFTYGDYPVAKHGVLGLMRSFSKLLNDDSPDQPSIRLNSIAPSWTSTGLAASDLLDVAGVQYQDPEVPARSALYLMADKMRHGQLILSRQGHFMEIEEPMLGRVRDIIKSLPGHESWTDSEDAEMRRIYGIAVALLAKQAQEKE